MYQPKDPTILEAVALVKAGSTVRQACDVTGCDPANVNHALRRLGIKAPQAKRPQIPADQIRELARSGVQLVHIAERFGISYATAAKYAQIQKHPC